MNNTRTPSEGVNHGVCNRCGAENVKNPRTNKIFCSAKCWLNEPTQHGATVSKVPEVEKVVWQSEPFEKKRNFGSQAPMYARFATDLTIALLQKQMALVQAGFIKTAEQLETVEEVAKKATSTVQEMRKNFE